MMMEKGVIKVFKMADVYLGLKILDTLPLKIWKKLLMVIENLDIGYRPDTLAYITHVNMVDCFIYLLIIVRSMIFFMKM